MFFACSATAVTYTDNFSGAKNTLDWTALDYACLTAGDGTAPANGANAIPACASAIDLGKSGALRLTPAANQQTGAILSNFTFPMSQGLQVTFTTYTYGGDSGGLAQDGADGIAFFLTDGSKATPGITGGSGGSLGYSCSNVNDKSEGIANGYIGLGIDEFGNFLNSGDNTSTGVLNSNNPNYSGVSANGSNDHYDSNHIYYQPGRIGLRGAGNVTWAWLQSQNSDYYSGGLDIPKMHDVCSSGTYVSSGADSGGQRSALPYNYKVVSGGYHILTDDTPIANESAQSRDQATPIIYKLKISKDGLLSFSYSYDGGAYTQVLVNNSIEDSNGPLPDSLKFGFSAGTGGSNNVHEITCFQASPLQSSSSAGANTVQSGEVMLDNGTQVYLASYSSDDWWGSVSSVPFALDKSGNLVISSTANWDAKCVLTGGACTSMTGADGVIPTITAQSPDSRVLLTSDVGPAKGSALEWSSLTTGQQDNLNKKAGDGTAGSRAVDSNGADRLSWLRGDRTNEQLISTTGFLRNRTGVLGDVIDSSPTWVGAPAAGTNPDAFADAIYGNSASTPENATNAQAYSAFVSANVSRLNVVYSGANDGMLHGFRSGSFTSDGSYDTSTNDGQEVLGFMPADIISSQSIVSLTDPLYSHHYLVDATPVAGDLFYGNAWHTWLVGGVGTEGAEIYALDITDPSSFKETATSMVVGDWDTTSSNMSNLGKTVGTPIISRMHDGKWAIIFGSGLGNGTGIYIGLVDPATGAVTFSFKDTQAPSGGMAYVTSVDLDGDHIADYIYAGDSQGNVWRYDVTSSDDTIWAYSTFGNKKSNPVPLFSATNADTGGGKQPITTAPVVAAVKSGGATRVMVFFGTGQKTPQTGTSGDTYATGTQTFYGIWDWDMSGWNKNAGTSAQFASLKGSQTVGRSNLLHQTVASTSATGASGQIQSYRYLSTTKKVCWQGSSVCTAASDNTQFGWLFDLPATNEQIIYNPTIIDGAVVVNTAIPPNISAQQCNPGLQSGWTMAFDPASGGGLTKSFFPGGTDGGTGTSAAGVKMDGVGTPAAVTYNGQTYLYTQTVPGTPALSQVNPPSSETPSRVSWKEIRY
jgi:type IV pilus assembly protein PilY1